MRISQLCEEAGIAVRRGGYDRHGHVYEANEYHFDFQLLDWMVFFRYRFFAGPGRWFVNTLFPDGDTASLTFTSIRDSDVMQVLIFYRWYEQGFRPETRSVTNCG
jgi:hypothetical protein